MNADETRSLRDRLESEIGTCLASDLQAHIKRGAVVVVDASIQLLDVALAVAQDDAAAVKGWIESERMKNPSLSQVEAWEKSPERPLRSVIVRPYVLVQELDGRETDGASAPS